MAATVYWREQGPWRFGQKLDSEDSRERSGRDFAMSVLTGDPLACGEGPELSTELPDGSLALARDSLRGAPMRTRGKLAHFLIPQ